MGVASRETASGMSSLRPAGAWSSGPSGDARSTAGTRYCVTYCAARCSNMQNRHGDIETYNHDSPNKHTTFCFAGRGFLPLVAATLVWKEVRGSLSLAPLNGWFGASLTLSLLFEVPGAFFEGVVLFFM